MLDAFIKERSELLAEYVIETGATVRTAAQHFGIPNPPYIRIYRSDCLNAIMFYTGKCEKFWM